MAHVCITGNEQSPAALEQRLERVLFGHPRVLCEVRLDYLDLSPANAFSFLARLPAEMANRLILTQRLKASGPVAAGNCTWDVLTWQSWWKDVMALRPWFAVDLDWLVLDRLAGESLAWRGKFRSRHAFFSLHGSLPEIGNSLPEILSSAKEHNAGVKIAAPVHTPREEFGGGRKPQGTSPILRRRKEDPQQLARKRFRRWFPICKPSSARNFSLYWVTIPKIVTGKTFGIAYFLSEAQRIVM